MVKHIKSIFQLVKETFQQWWYDETTQLAAGIAYFTIFSLAPLLIISIAVAGAVFGKETATGEIMEQIETLVGHKGAEVLRIAIESADKSESNRSVTASVISMFILLFGASRVFGQLQEALNKIWAVQAKPGWSLWGFLRKRILSFSMVLCIGFLLLVSLVLSAALSMLSRYMGGLVPGVDLLRILNFVISFGVTTLLFAMIYNVLPDVKIRWKDVWVGALITAVLFTAGKFVLGLYLGRGAFTSAYGAAGSLIIILVWVYYSAQILFLGAEFTQVYARKYGQTIVPDKHAVRVKKSEDQECATNG